MQKPVVIVGAGLAGLICARELHNSGVYVMLVDADDRPGGRLKTDVIGGFKLDRGFQVYLTAYPNGQEQLDYDALNLKEFRNGAIVSFEGHLHTLDANVSFRKKLATLFDKFLPISDKKKALAWNGEARSMSLAAIAHTHDETTEEFLRDYGFTDAFIDRFARPFFGGVFLDRSLKTSARQFAFVSKMLGSGSAALPEGGIEAIPKQIAHDIPKYLFRQDQRVDQVLTENGRASGVRFDTTETLDAAAVVVATDAETASELTGLETVKGSKASICLYFETPTPCVEDAFVVLNGNGTGLVNEVAPITNAAPSYAPAGKHLVSVTILGESSLSDDELAEAAKKELEAWFPDKGVYMWRFIKAYRIRYSQMAQDPGVWDSLPSNTTSTPGLFFAGEFTENASIDGAIRSGIRCAQAILASLKGEAAA